MRLGAGAASTAALATTAAVATAARRPHGGAGQCAAAIQALSLHAMPAWHGPFGRAGHGHLTVRARMFGLTPGSSHPVDLRIPGQSRVIRFSTLTADQRRPGARHPAQPLQRPGAARQPPAGPDGTGRRRGLDADRRDQAAGRSRPRAAPAHRGRGRPARYQLRHAAWAGPLIAYNASRQTLTVTVHASGVTPGPHAAHVHLGSCMARARSVHAAGPAWPTAAAGSRARSGSSPT